MALLVWRAHTHTHTNKTYLMLSYDCLKNVLDLRMYTRNESVRSKYKWLNSFGGIGILPPSPPPLPPAVSNTTCEQIEQLNTDVLLLLLLLLANAHKYKHIHSTVY